MLKRILMLLMLCTLLLTAQAGAEDLYEMIDNALYRIVLRTETGDENLGSGVLFRDNISLLTTEGCAPEGNLYAIGTDGEHRIASRLIWGGNVVFLELETPSAATPLTLAPEDAQSLPFLFGTNNDGERGTMPLYMARADLQGELRSLLLSSEEGLMPGAFLTDEKGQLTALITGQHTEGLGSYAALGVYALRQVFAEEAPAETLLDCALSWEDGQLTISWTDAQHDEGVYVITLISSENQYYITYEAAITERSLVLTPPPGHTYSVQVERAASEADAQPPLWETMQDYTLPLLPFSAYGFQGECALVSIPAGSQVTGTESPMSAFTSAALTDPGRDILLSVTCSYTVPAACTANLALELCSPDGQFFFDELTIDLDPALAQEDSFVLPMDDLLQSCLEFSGGMLQEGEYTVQFFLEGCQAGACTFTVTAEDAVPAASPAPATEGFVTGLTAQHENGLLTLTWDAASVPADAKLRAYAIHGLSPYFVYQEPQPGSTTAQVFTVPGTPVIAWVAWSASGEFTPTLPIQREDQYVLLDAADETPFTAHSFRNVRIGLAASADPDAGTRTDFLPQAPITREMLSDRQTPIYFMTEDTYQVGASSEDHPLVIALLTPEGLCLADLGYYIFDISLQSSDLWLKDISKLFADYETITGSSAWPAGEYRILYCIDGQVAGEIRFTLE